MKQTVLLLLFGSLATSVLHAAPSYLWLETDRFDGVRGVNHSFLDYPSVTNAPGWGLNGPGVSAEWGQGGESEWTSIAAHKDETNATVTQRVEVPSTGDYRVWVRYADHQFKTEVFRIRIEQGGKTVFDREFGGKPIIDEHDEFKMYWSWVFAWDSAEGKLSKGSATITLLVDKPAQARRHVDVIVLTDDLNWRAEGRMKPPFAYFNVLEKWRQNPARKPGTRNPELGTGGAQGRLAGSDFWMPWNMPFDWWNDAQGMTVPYSVEAKIQKSFIAEFKSQNDVPIFSAPFVVPAFHINETQKFLSDDSPFLRWLKETKKPFAINSNYGRFVFKSDAEATQCYHNLKALGDQFLGFISGESIAHGVAVDSRALVENIKTAKTRAEIVQHYHDAYDAALRKKHDDAFKTDAGPMWDKLITCLSSESDTWAHALREWGCTLVGMETAAVQPCWARRIAFSRGAARQYGGNFFYYHAPNFGDTASTFTYGQNFAGPDAWFHTRYGLVWGPSLSWYRKAYHLYYMSGASAIYLEQGFDQFFKPGPGNHPVQLNPLGKVTDEFIRFAAKHPDRGVPYTPIAFLLDCGHGWDDVHYTAGAFNRDPTENPILRETDGDRMIREMFNVAFYPHPVTEGEPCTAERQAFVSGVFGDIFDVLVNSPTHREIIHGYPALIVSGNIDLTSAWLKELRTYVERGGTLLVSAGQVPPEMNEIAPFDVRQAAKAALAEASSFQWGGEAVDCAPYRYQKLALANGAKPLATAPDGAAIAAERSVGKGRVIMATVPYLLDNTRRAHPLAARFLIHIADGLLPVQVAGDVQFLLNRNSKGWLITLFNNRGNYKPQQGLAAPRREETAEVTLTTAIPIQGAREWIEDSELQPSRENDRMTLKLIVPAGGIRIVELSL